MTTRASLTFLASFCLLSTSLARADDLSALVDRYVAWRGGAAFEHLQALHEQGTIEVSGLHGKYDAWSSRDGRRRIDLDLGVLKQTQTYAPGGSWQTNQSGQVSAPPTADVEAARRSASLEFAQALRGEGKASATLTASRSRDGRNWSVVHVSFGDEDTYDVLIDPKSGELGGYDIVEDRKPRFEGFSDWRVVHGVRLPFTQTVRSVANGDSTIKLKTAGLNPPLAAALFARPEGGHKVSFAAGSTVTPWIDFNFLDNERIYIPAKVNGHAIELLLDSGAEVSVLDQTFAASIGLKSQGAVATTGAGGVDAMGLTGGVTVELPGMTLNDLTVATLDFKPIGELIGHPLPFVLGVDVFNETGVEIDFAAHRVRFHALEGLQPPAGAVLVPLPKITSNRAVPVAVEGADPVPFDFDLGNGSALDVFPAYYGPHHLLENRRASETYGGAVGGMHSEPVALLHEVVFAGVTLHGVPAGFSPDSVSAMNSNKTFGNIGLGILSRFQLLIDFAHDRLWATPYPDAATATFVRNRSGLTLKPAGDVLEVLFAAPGSPAQVAGFKAGEKVSSIDGKSASQWTMSSLQVLGNSPAGRSVEIKLVDGTVRQLKLADYY